MPDIRESNRPSREQHDWRANTSFQNLAENNIRSNGIDNDDSLVKSHLDDDSDPSSSDKESTDFSIDKRRELLEKEVERLNRQLEKGRHHKKRRFSAAPIDLSRFEQTEEKTL